MMDLMLGIAFALMVVGPAVVAGWHKAKSRDREG